MWCNPSVCKLQQSCVHTPVQVACKHRCECIARSCISLVAPLGGELAYPLQACARGSGLRGYSLHCHWSIRSTEIITISDSLHLYNLYKPAWWEMETLFRNEPTLQNPFILSGMNRKLHTACSPVSPVILWRKPKGKEKFPTLSFSAVAGRNDLDWLQPPV